MKCLTHFKRDYCGHKGRGWWEAGWMAGSMFTSRTAPPSHGAHWQARMAPGIRSWSALESSLAQSKFPHRLSGQLLFGVIQTENKRLAPSASGLQRAASNKLLMSPLHLNCKLRLKYHKVETRHRNHRNKYMANTDHQDLLWKALITTCKNSIFTYQKWLQILIITVSLEVKVALIQKLPDRNCKIYRTFLYTLLFTVRLISSI